MSKLESYLTHPLAEAVGWTLLHSLWQGALVALLFAGSLMLMRNRGPQLRYVLGCAALVLLVVLPVVTGARLYDPGVQSQPGFEPQVRIESGSGASTMLTQADGAALSAPASVVLPTPPVLELLVARALGLLETGAPWLAGIWLAGVALLLLRLCGQALYVQRFRARHRTPADADWQARARALAARLGVRGAWRLVQSDQAESPLTFGVLRPLIVLPTSALTGMPAAQLEALLAHEFAHIRRHDYLVNLVQCVLETLLFYHPAVWWVSGEVRRAREECCDDLAVSLCGDARLYTRALTNLECLHQGQPALTLAATDGPLLVRVQRLLGLKEAQHTPPLATGALLLLTVAASVALSFSPLPVAAQNAAEADAQPGSLWVSVSPGVTFDDAYTRISEMVIPSKSYVLIEERTATARRTVRVTRGASDTDFVYTYTVDGAARAFDTQAQTWLDDSLQVAALGPLKDYAASQTLDDEREGFNLVAHLDYDDVSNRYISFVLAADARLEPSSMMTIETSLGKQNLLSRVAHFAAHGLVADSETGDYLKLFIKRSSVVQLETLTPDITSIIAEMEDEAVKAEVRQALEVRINGATTRPEGRAEQVNSNRDVRLASTATTSPSGQEAPKQGSSLGGVVMWNDERLANIKVELQRFVGPWDLPHVLQTTRTNSKGEFSFENVPPEAYTDDDYTVWAVGEAEGYLSVGLSAAAYAGTSGYEMLRLYKPIDVISPKGTSGTSLTPTLRWKPVPGAVRYEVGIDDLTPPEDPMMTQLNYRTDEPSLKITKPLERNRFYRWSVKAYTQDGTQIAIDIESPMFSTGSRKTLRPVNLRSVGASTVLPADWQQTSPGVFEYVNAEGERGTLTFEKLPRAALEASLGSDALAELKQFSQRYAGRDWGSTYPESGSVHLVTVQDDTAYLITATGLEFEELAHLTVEVLGLVVPTMLRNFEITG